MKANAAAFGVIYLSVGMLLVAPLFIPMSSNSLIAPEQMAPVALSTPDPPDDTMPSWLNDEERERWGPRAQLLSTLLVFSWIGGALLFFALLLFSPHFRQWAWTFPGRTAPAFCWPDLMAALVLLLGCQRLIYALQFHVLACFNLAHDAAGRFALSMLSLLVLYAVMLPVLIWLARRRGGPGGASSFWPVHKTPGLMPSSDISFDLLVGLGTYLLMSWLTLAAHLLNKYLVFSLGGKVDQNPLVDIFTQECGGQGRFWVLAALALVATFGVAFFEELLFRGLLYNVMQRYMATYLAAPLAALAFAAVHGVVSQIIPLFVLALLMTYAYERSGRLLAPIVLHATNNGLIMVLLLCG